MRTDPPAGRSYREHGLLESLARALRPVPGTRRLRARLIPVFRRLRASTPMQAVLPGGETFVVSPAARHVTWNPDEYAAFRGAVRPGAIVIDAGANVGAYSVLFAQWAGAHGHVFAFEPDPSAFEGLVAHIDLNGLRDRITPVRAAVTAGSVSRVPFVLSPSSGLARIAGTADRRENLVAADAISIDEFCSRRGVVPSVMKIDVEGAELEVLRGSGKSIAAAGPELALFVEMHPSVWGAFGTAAADLGRECEALGLELEHLDGTRDNLWTREGVCLRLRRRASL